MEHDDTSILENPHLQGCVSDLGEDYFKENAKMVTDNLHHELSQSSQKDSSSIKLLFKRLIEILNYDSFIEMLYLKIINNNFKIMMSSDFLQEHSINQQYTPYLSLISNRINSLKVMQILIVFVLFRLLLLLLIKFCFNFVFLTSLFITLFIDVIYLFATKKSIAIFNISVSSKRFVQLYSTFVRTITLFKQSISFMKQIEMLQLNPRKLNPYHSETDMPFLIPFKRKFLDAVSCVFSIIKEETVQCINLKSMSVEEKAELICTLDWRSIYLQIYHLEISNLEEIESEGLYTLKSFQMWYYFVFYQLQEYCFQSFLLLNKKNTKIQMHIKFLHIICKFSKLYILKTDLILQELSDLIESNKFNLYNLETKSDLPQLSQSVTIRTSNAIDVKTKLDLLLQSCLKKLRDTNTSTTHENNVEEDLNISLLKSLKYDLENAIECVKTLQLNITQNRTVQVDTVAKNSSHDVNDLALENNNENSLSTVELDYSDVQGPFECQVGEELLYEGYSNPINLDKELLLNKSLDVLQNASQAENTQTVLKELKHVLANKEVERLSKRKIATSTEFDDEQRNNTPPSLEGGLVPKIDTPGTNIAFELLMAKDTISSIPLKDNTYSCDSKMTTNAHNLLTSLLVNPKHSIKCEDLQVYGSGSDSD